MHGYNAYYYYIINDMPIFMCGYDPVSFDYCCSINKRHIDRCGKHPS